MVPDERSFLLGYVYELNARNCRNSRNFRTKLELVGHRTPGTIDIRGLKLFSVIT
jgi:hypothetical protein